MQLLPILLCVGATFASLVGAHVQEALRTGQIPCRGVNLGGWLVAEQWMTWSSPIWQDVPKNIYEQGEYVTMKHLGHDVGDPRFEEHRSTWITESDIAEIASYGLNTVRVPVGFWILGYDSTDWPNIGQWKVYAPGALKYLDQLINDWALKYNVAVMLSLHAHKGSQNGFDHSAPVFSGEHNWADYWENRENSVQFATFLAERYRYSPAFLGMNLMNEPSGIDMGKVQEYYKRTYKLIRDSGNDCVIVVSPSLGEQGPPAYQDFMRWPEFYNVWHEWHPYYAFPPYTNMNARQIIDAARNYANQLKSWSGNWIFLGEWSLATPWNVPFTDAERSELTRVMVDSFANAHSGWTFWSWRHSDEANPNGWSMRQNLRTGVLKL